MANRGPSFWHGHGTNEITERQRAILARPEMIRRKPKPVDANHGRLSRHSIPGVSAACEAGKHSRCTKSACTCATCNHNGGIL